MYVKAYPQLGEAVSIGKKFEIVEKINELAEKKFSHVKLKLIIMVESVGGGICEIYATTCWIFKVRRL